MLCSNKICGKCGNKISNNVATQNHSVQNYSATSKNRVLSRLIGHITTGPITDNGDSEVSQPPWLI